MASTDTVLRRFDFTVGQFAAANAAPRRHWLAPPRTPESASPGTEAWFDAWLDASDAAGPENAGRTGSNRGRALLIVTTPVLAVALSAAPYSMPRPTRPSVSITSNLFPEAVPGFDRELGLQLPSRPTTPEAETGLRLGSVRVRPALEEGFGYDSNVQGIRGGRGSALLRTAPEVSVQSDWSRNRLGAYLGIENSAYFDAPRQSRTDVAAAIGGGYTIGRGDATVAYSLLHLHDDPGALGGLPASTPIPFTVNDLRADYTANFGRFAVTPFADYSIWRYGRTQVAGATLDQGYRDREVLQAGAGGRYQFAEQRSLIASASVTHAQFGRQPLGGAAPNSVSLLALGGADYQVTGAVRVRALAGLEAREFQSPAFRSRTEPVGLASLIWTPTRLTTVTGTLARSVEDLAQEDAGGTAYTRAEVSVVHEYLRDVLLRGVAGVQSAEFLQRGGTQTTAYGGLGVTWRLNRNLRLLADYQCRWQSALPEGNAAAAAATFLPGRVGSGGYVRNLAQLSLQMTL